MADWRRMRLHSGMSANAAAAPRAWFVLRYVVDRASDFGQNGSVSIKAKNTPLKVTNKKKLREVSSP